MRILIVAFALAAGSTASAAKSTETVVMTAIACGVAAPDCAPGPECEPGESGVLDEKTGNWNCRPDTCHCQPDSFPTHDDVRKKSFGHVGNFRWNIERCEWEGIDDPGVCPNAYSEGKWRLCKERAFPKPFFKGGESGPVRWFCEEEAKKLKNCPQSVEAHCNNTGGNCGKNIHQSGDEERAKEDVCYLPLEVPEPSDECEEKPKTKIKSTDYSTIVPPGQAPAVEFDFERRTHPKHESDITGTK